MPLKLCGKYCGKTMLILIEGIAIVAVIGILALGALMWRLAQGPADVTFAREYVAEALNAQLGGLHVHLETITLSWPDYKGPLVLDLSAPRITDAQGKDLLKIYGVKLGLARAPLLIGQVEPVAIFLDKPVLTLSRNAQGAYNFIFSQNEAETEDEEQDPAGPTAPAPMLNEFRHWLFDHNLVSGTDNPAIGFLAALRRVEMHAARLSYRDATVRRRLSLYSVDFIMTRDEDKGFSLAMKGSRLRNPRFTDAVPTTFMLGVEIPAGEKQAQIKMTLKDLAPRDYAPWLPLINDYVVPRLKTDLRLQGIYDDEQQTLKIAESTATLGETTIGLSGDLAYDAQQKTYRGTAEAEITDLPQNAIGPLWPPALVEENARKWLVENISKGRFQKIHAQTHFNAAADAQGQWQVQTKNTALNFAFKDMTIDYNAPMTPVTKAKGKGAFFLDQEILRVDLEEGNLGGLDITNAQMELSHIIEAGKGQADLFATLEGPLAAAIAFVQKKPIEAAPEINVSAVQGKTAFQVNLDFPTQDDLKIEDVAIALKGKAHDVFLPDAAGPLDLRGGPFDVAVKDGAFTVNGNGQLETQPARVDYLEYLDSKGKPFLMQVKAEVRVDPAMRAQLGIALDDYLQGPVDAKIVYTETSKAKAHATADLDLAPAVVTLKPFTYEKPAGVAGRAQGEAQFEKGFLTVVNDLSIVAPALAASGANLTFYNNAQETELASARFSHFVVGETTGNLNIQTASNGKQTIALQGSFLDLRPFMAAPDPAEKAGQDKRVSPMEISVAVERMRTADTQMVENVKIYADMDDQARFNQLEMDATAGQGQIYLRYKPDESGKRIFRLEADDAGATLRAFDMYDKVQGGRLVIYAEPSQGYTDRNLIGLAEITDFRVVNAPTLARLLSAMSLPGLLGLLDDQGLAFSKMEARFDWLYRPEGSAVIVQEGRTSGNEVGLTFDGVYDRAQNKIDIEGTIVPLSTVNKIIGSIPLLGDIITGGTGSLIAATYTIEGSAQEPDVSVNPLSVLTPGILRRILFE
ncbi:MAG: AsmA-like C-terminal domain-containing protein [Alphaproteobacteria bacterium]|nr:AsmA-like C-terminal domain-containing protein [Alphaproteobacteria bacterium]